VIEIVRCSTSDLEASCVHGRREADPKEDRMKIKITREDQTTRPGTLVITMKREAFTGLYSIIYLTAQVGPDNRLYWRGFLTSAKGLTEAQARKMVAEEVARYGEDWGITYAEAENTGLCP
jgi:hypothetical protein